MGHRPTTPSRPRCTSPRPRRSSSGCCPRCEHLRDALARQGRGLRAHHQDRPHPPPGRDAADARPGVLRLCGAARPRPRADRAYAAAGSMHWRRAARRSARASTPSRISPSRSPRGSPRLTACPSPRRPTSSRRWPRHDAMVFAHGAINTRRRGLFKIANDIRFLGAARARAWANSSAGERARLVDHAGQGQSRPSARR